VQVLVALSTSVAGVATLHRSWRHPHAWSRPTAAVGWLLLVLSVPLWIRVGGVEFGTAFAMMAAAFAAWGVIAALGRESRPSAERRTQARAPAGRPDRATVWRTLARVAVAVPVAGCAGLLLSLAVVARLPWLPANRYVGAILLAPIAWGVLATWASTTSALPRVALLLAGVSVACAAVLFVR
jgi:hypothetical protein